MWKATRTYLIVLVVLILVGTGLVSVVNNYYVVNQTGEKIEYYGPGLHVDLDIKENNDDVYLWKGNALGFKARFPYDIYNDGIYFESKNYKINQKLESIDEIKVETFNTFTGSTEVDKTNIAYRDILEMDVDIEFTVGFESLKEIIVLNKRPDDLEKDLIIEYEILHDDLMPYPENEFDSYDNNPKEFETEKGIEFRNFDGAVIFYYPRMIAYDSPLNKWSSIEKSMMPDPGTIDKTVCKYKLDTSRKSSQLQIIIPLDFLADENTDYPVYIDPTITPNPVNTTVVYEGLINGTIKRTEDANVTYYEDVENTIIMDSDLIVTTGSLTLINITLKMNSTFDGEHKIQVQENGALYILSESSILNGTASNYYDFYFNDGSYGLISDSTILMCGYDNGGGGGIVISSDNVIIQDSFIMNGDLHGIVINHSSPVIDNNYIMNFPGDAILTKSSYPVIKENNIVNSSVGIHWENNVWNETFDNWNNINTSENIILTAGHVELDNKSISSGYLLTEDIEIFSYEIWKNIWVNKTTTSNTSIKVSLIDSVTDSIISFFDELTTSFIDLTQLDPYEHNKIRLNVSFYSPGDGTSTPYLYDLGVLIPKENLWVDSFTDSSKVSLIDNITISNGTASLAPKVLVDENANDNNLSSYWNQTGWNESSTFNEEDYIWNITLDGSDVNTSYVKYNVTTDPVNDPPEDGVYNISGQARFIPDATMKKNLPFFGFNNTYPYFDQETPPNSTSFNIKLYPENIYSGPATSKSYPVDDAYGWFNYNISVTIENGNITNRTIFVYDLTDNSTCVIEAYWSGSNTSFNSWGIEIPITGNGQYFGSYQLDNLSVVNGAYTDGNITSSTITPQLYEEYSYLYINKTEPDSQHYILINIVDAITGDTIDGYDNLTGTLYNLSGIRRETYPSINLRAYFHGDKAGSSKAYLEKWQVGFISDIGGNTIRDCNKGILINASSVGVTDNTLINNSISGIELMYSSSEINKNEISSSPTGIGIYSIKSTPVMEGNNIYDSAIGIYLEDSMDISENTLPITNSDRDVIFTTGTPPVYDGEKYTNITVPNSGNAFVTDAKIKLSGEPANYYGYSWMEPDTKLSNGPFEYYYPYERNPDITVDYGYIYVVWEDYRDNDAAYNDADIYFNKYEEGYWLEEDVKISNGPADTNQRKPVVAVYEESIYVAWEDDRNGDLDIYFNMYDGYGWGTSDTLISEDLEEPPGTGIQNNVTIDASIGFVYVAWDEDRIGDYDIYYNEFDGVEWLPSTVLISNGPDFTHQRDPSICDVDGTLYVAFEDDRNTYWDIYLNTRSGGSWGGSDQLVSNDPGINPEENQYDPDIADNDTYVYVVWEDDRSTTDFDIYCNYYDGFVWLTSDELVSNGLSNTNELNPKVTIAYNIVYSVWQDDRNGSRSYDIYCNNKTGTSWGGQDTNILDNSSDTAQIVPSIASEDDDVYVVWQDYRNGDSDIYYNHSDNGVWDNANLMISNDKGSYAENAQGKPSIAVENNSIYLVWQDDRDGDNDIYYNRYNGTSWLEEDEKISHGTAGSSQENPVITVYNGKIAVVWQDDRNANYDIYSNMNEGSGWNSTDTKVNDDISVLYQINPDIVYESNVVYAIWEDYRNGTKTEIYFDKFTGGAWGTDVKVSKDTSSRRQSSPAICSVDSTHIYAVWANGTIPAGIGNNASVMFNSYNGTYWSANEIFVNQTEGDSNFPDIYAVDNDHIYVVWDDYDIYFNERIDGSWSNSHTVVNSDHYGATYPTVTAISNLVYVAWQDYRNINYDIYFNMRNGTWRNYDEKVNKDSGSSNQYYPAIIADDNDVVHLVWDDSRNDLGDVYYNNFTQRYSQSYPCNPTMDAGDDGDYEWVYDGWFTSQDIQVDITDEINEYLLAQDSVERTISIPVKFNSDTPGKIIASEIEIIFELRPFIENSTIENCTNGIYSISSNYVLDDIRFTENIENSVLSYDSKIFAYDLDVSLSPIGINSTNDDITVSESIFEDLNTSISGLNSTLEFIDSTFLENDIVNEMKSSTLTTRNCYYDENNITFDGNSSVIDVYNSTLVESNILEFNLSNDSHARLINTSHDFESVDIYDISTLSVNWFIHIRILNSNNTAKENAYFSIYNITKSDIHRRDYYTEEGGYLKWILCREYLINSSNYRKYDTPHEIKVGNNNDINFVSDISKQITLYFGTDSDMDYYDDDLEDQFYNLWFEAEHHVREQGQIISYGNYGDSSNGAAISHQDGSKYIINNTFPKISGYEHYKYFVRARIDDNSTDMKFTQNFNSLNLSVYDNSTPLVLGDSHLVNNKYRWYSTPRFITNATYLRLQATQEDLTAKTILIDRVLLMYFDNITRAIPTYGYGQFTDPLSPDTDMDMLLDGYEVRNNTYVYEVEDYYNDTNPGFKQVWDDINSSNSKVVSHQYDLNLISSITQTAFVDDFNCYIKARTFNGIPGSTMSVEVKIGPDVSEVFYFELNETLEWYKTSTFLGYGYPSVLYTSITINIWDESDADLIDLEPTVLVDQVILVGISGVFQDKFDADIVDQLDYEFQNNSYNLSSMVLPYDAIVTSATFDITGTSDRQEVSKESEDSSITPAVYGDKIVWSDNRDASNHYSIYMYDLTEKKEYRITNQTGVEDKNVSIWENLIVFDRCEGYFHSIYIFDLTWDNDTDGVPNYKENSSTGGKTPENFSAVKLQVETYDSLKPDIWEDIVVWEDIRNATGATPYDWNIYMYDLSMDSDNNSIPNWLEEDRGDWSFDPAEKQITSDIKTQMNAKVSDYRIVWQDNRPNDPMMNSDWDVYLYDINANISKFLPYRTRQITTSNDNQENPDIYGSRIVYTDDRIGNDGFISLYLYELLIETEILIHSETEYFELMPVIYGDKIIWEHLGFGNILIYGYDLSTDSDWDGTPNYMESPRHTVDPALLYISTKATSSISPAIGGDVPVWLMNDDIFMRVQNYTIDIGDDGSKEWTHTELFSIPECTPNIARSLNEYLRAHQADVVDDKIIIPMNITSEYVGGLNLTNLSIKIEFTLDPMNPDTDGDALPDGHEFFRYFGYDILEFEDAIEYKSWSNPYLERNYDFEAAKPDFINNESTMMHQTYVTLTTSFNMIQNNSYKDSWVKLRFLVNETGNYKLKISPKYNQGELKLNTNNIPLLARRWVGTNVRGGDDPRDGFYYTVNLNSRGGQLTINESAEEYLQKVLRNITYIEVKRDGVEIEEPLPGKEDFSSVIYKLDRMMTIDNIYNNNISVSSDLAYSGEYSLRQHSYYDIVIGMDYKRLPKELDPDYKDDESVTTEIPDGLAWDYINHMEMVNLDCIRVERQTLDPLAYDADNDGLPDGFEDNDNMYPLNPDADGDGLNDYIEMFTTGTNYAYRDTDFDGIRDGVETGFTQADILENNGEVSSIGSWWERIAHWSNPFNYTPVNNFDADDGATTTDPFDNDTDDDYLPDGWTDGWLYQPNPILPEDIQTFHINRNRYKDINTWRYMEKYWGRYGPIDNKVQIYEGEDLNLDGKKDGDAPWGFDPISFEFDQSKGVYESDPNEGDTDGDEVPDGYEVWYAHIDPIIDPDIPDDPMTGVNESYIIDPTNGNDWYYDKDAEEKVIYDSGAEGISYPIDGIATFAIAQKITLPNDYDYWDISKIEVLLEDWDSDYLQMEIWYGEKHDGIDAPRAWLKILNAYEEGLDGWYGFKTPFDTFYTDANIDGDLEFYIVMRYIDVEYYWNNASNSNSWIFTQQGDGSWLNFSNEEMCYRLFAFDFENEGDNLTNRDEYIVGTNPKSNNTDKIVLGHNVYDDLLTDGQEVGFDPGETEFRNETVFPDLPQGGVIYRTNIDDGAIYFDGYKYDSSGFILFDGDGEGTNLSGARYDYWTTMEDPPAYYNFTSDENTLMFTLDDGGKIYLSRDKDNYHFILWEPDVNPGNYETNDAGEKYLDGICVIYNKTSPYDLSTAFPNMTYRYQEIYYSSPFHLDTDGDALLDGEEVDCFSEAELSGRDPDSLINVRDYDSDNDGLADGDEYNYSVDLAIDPDDLENMIDPDSDNDTLLDGDEPDYDQDTDSDSTVNMEDKDADADGLIDGKETSPFSKDNSVNSSSVSLTWQLNDPQGVDVDRDGNVFYLLDGGGSDSLVMLEAGFDELENTGNSDNLYTLVSYNTIWDPIDLKVDSDGNIFWTENAASVGKYLKMLPKDYDKTNVTRNNVNVTTLLDNHTGGIDDPHGITVDSIGNIYFIDGSTIKMLQSTYLTDNTTSNGENVTTILTALNAPEGLEMSSTGNLFFTSFNYSGSLNKLESGFSKTNFSLNHYYTLLKNIGNSHDIDLDASGNIYFRRSIAGTDSIWILPAGYLEVYSDLNDNDIFMIISLTGSYDCYDFAVSGNGDLFYIQLDGSNDTLEKLRVTRTSPVKPDTDSDGLWDGHNVTNGSDVLHAGELEYHITPQQHQTYQLVADSDGDGLDDGLEVASVKDGNLWAGWTIMIITVSPAMYTYGAPIFQNVSSNPMDTSGDTESDGISDLKEYHYTNPMSNDTDGDGLLDQVEDANLNGRLSTGETSPVDRDTDKDRLADGVWNGIGEDLDCNGIRDVYNESDPLDSDTDNDRVPDGNEYYYINNASEITEYNDSDSDGYIDLVDFDADNDGLSDGQENWDLDTELDWGMLPNWTGGNFSGRIESDPTKNDSDEDGLLDGAEPLGFEDIDRDGLINIWDYDSNIIGESANSDYFDVYVIFRTNATDRHTGYNYNDGSQLQGDGDTDNILDYRKATWISIFYYENLQLYNDGYHDKDGNPVQVQAPYVYDRTSTTLGEHEMTPINLEWADAAGGEPGIPRVDQDLEKDLYLTSADGFPVGIYNETGPPDSEKDIVINVTNETGTWYHFYTPDTSGYVDTDYLNEHSLPYKYLPADPLENFVDKHQEYYDPRVALNLDIDFDGASNSAELLAGTNPFDADTDNDGVPDGYEMAWNKDSDGDGTVKECRLNITDGDILIKYNNGINALDPDSDDDAIYDGVETGITGGVWRSGINHSNTNQATGLDWNTSKAPDYELYPDNFPFSNFKADSDPTTTTNMTLVDTDNDGLNDTSEDLNRNGYVDSYEPDPNDMDSDDDGLMDGDYYERLADSDSDAVYNCLEKDSDGDGLYDGTEVGLTSPVQGNDEFEGTDLDAGNFVMDMHTLSTTDPWVADTDEDGLSDGVEDANKDGCFDWFTETDPNDQDTDDDGLFDGSAANGYGDLGEDTDNDGTVDDGETDPSEQDTDGDNLYDGDEVNPTYISLDEIPNRQDPITSLWYNSDPTEKDTDGDNLNDDEELIGWDVRIFWEATLETAKGPYDVWSDPENDDTDGDQLSDLNEFRYGSDPNMEDSDDDNTNDKNEVDNNDNPTGIEGRPPDVEWIKLTTTPIVSELSGLYYLDGWNVKLQLKVQDSSGPYFIKFQELLGTPVQKYLQEVDKEYYATEVINDISVEVKNDGSFDYAGAFFAYIEDSVGNNVSVFIAGGGLPVYNDDEIKNIYESGGGKAKAVGEVEWVTVNGSGEMDIEGLNWLARKIADNYFSQIQKLFKSKNDDLINTARNFIIDFFALKTTNDENEILKFFKETDIMEININEFIDSQQSTRADSTSDDGGSITSYRGHLYTYVYNYLHKDLEPIDPDNDNDGDGLLNWEELLRGTNLELKDTDHDGLTDYEEVGKESIEININKDNVIKMRHEHFKDDDNTAVNGDYYWAVHQDGKKQDYIDIEFELDVHGLYDFILRLKLTDYNSGEKVRTIMYLDNVYMAIFDYSSDEWGYVEWDLGYLDAGTHKITLKNHEEKKSGSDVNVAWDYFVISSRYWTDPKNPDSDGDGIGDQAEFVVQDNVVYKKSTAILTNFYNDYYFGTGSLRRVKIKFDEWREVTKMFLPVHFNSYDDFSIYEEGHKRKIFSFKNIYLNTPKITKVMLKVKSSWSFITSIEMKIEASVNPNSDDTDNDGLYDGWEASGIPHNYGGDEGKRRVWTQIPYSEKPNPVMKDIYVEVDWMQAVGWEDDWKNYDRDHKLDSDAQNKVKKAFQVQGIKLHIDDGTGDWSGGTGIWHIDTLSSSDVQNIIKDSFSDERRLIFHYCIMAHRLDPKEFSPLNSGFGYAKGETFIVADAIVGWAGDSAVANSFMHELGHNLGLGDIDRWNHDMAPLGYVSCMNYFHNLIVDYHDGSNGYYDDWGNLNLRGFMS